LLAKLIIHRHTDTSQYIISRRATADNDWSLRANNYVAMHTSYVYKNASYARNAENHRQ